MTVAVRSRPMSWRKFHYPTRWPWYKNTCMHDTRGKCLRTLIQSPVFRVAHTATGHRFNAVMTLERSDRDFMWMILARVPGHTPMIGRHNFLDTLPYHWWYGCSEAHTEICLSHVDAGLDFPFHIWRRIPVPHDSMRLKMCDMWNVWLALDIGLRGNGFTMPAKCFPFLAR